MRLETVRGDGEEEDKGQNIKILSTAQKLIVYSENNREPQKTKEGTPVDISALEQGVTHKTLKPIRIMKLNQMVQTSIFFNEVEWKRK